MEQPDENTPATLGDLRRLGDRVADRLIEVYRDGETKLLQAFYSFAQINESAAIKKRLATVEERILVLERKVNFPEHPAS